MRKAFSMLQDLPPNPRILEIGCGPGTQTLELARLANGTITAIDTYQPYLDRLTQNAREQGLENRINAQYGDMFDLSFLGEPFDLIWSEGAIYILGFDRGFKAWKNLLKPQGYLAVTEISWLQSNPSTEIQSFWNENYPNMRDIETNREQIRQAGYREIGNFVLPESDWWNYYDSIEAKIVCLKEKYRNDRSSIDLLNSEQREIDLYRKYSSEYSYVFYIAQVA
ncbi:MAG: class I SAM-dependent methyltransferase [Cyanobacteria bacterium SID2]|nr:class I SAM-dependent methyltransferase [Cyanobacteria bacterium SID2]MBP0002883.1 class I SAM-dependent methyltransferase [Cyanobacteria bacterium SBC]